MTYPLVQDLAAEGIPVRLTCGVLGFSTQAFYKWRARPCSDRDYDDAHLTNALVDLHEGDPQFGYRFLTDELKTAGHRVGERRVWRLCRQQRLWSTTVKKGRHGKRPGQAVHDDLVQRNFTAPRPDAIWLTDITEHPTACIPAIVATLLEEQLRWVARSTAMRTRSGSSICSTREGRSGLRLMRPAFTQLPRTRGCGGLGSRCSEPRQGCTRRQRRPSSMTPR